MKVSFGLRFGDKRWLEGGRRGPRVNRDVHVAGNAASWEEQRGWNRRFILGAEWPADLERMIRARQYRTSKAQQGGLCLSLQAKGS